MKRDDHGRRIFNDDLDLLALIRCMKQTGMPLEDIRQFVSWCQLVSGRRWHVGRTLSDVPATKIGG